MNIKTLKTGQFVEYMGARAQIETIDEKNDCIYVFDHAAYNGGWIHNVKNESPINLRVINSGE